MIATEQSNETRLNVRVKGPLALHVQQRIGDNGLYENPSEYIRDLIRHDMLQEEERKNRSFHQAVMSSMESPTSDLEYDFFDKKRQKLKALQKAKQDRER